MNLYTLLKRVLTPLRLELKRILPLCHTFISAPSVEIEVLPQPVCQISVLD